MKIVRFAYRQVRSPSTRSFGISPAGTFVSAGTWHVHQTHPARSFASLAAHRYNAVFGLQSPLVAANQSTASSPIDFNHGFESLDTNADDSQTLRRFDELPNMHPILLQVLTQNGYEKTTEIQNLTWEKILDPHSDVVGRARTGTGKTLAFLLPSLQRILSNPDPTPGYAHTLVISPTRELCRQIDEQTRLLTTGINLSTARRISNQALYGGTPKRRDLMQFESDFGGFADIVTVTPGRLADHLKTTTVLGNHISHYLSKLQVLVLDEMDTLLNMGFRDQLDEILKFLPPPAQRQTLLFSATLPSEVRTVISQYTRQSARSTELDGLSPRLVYIDCVHDNDPSTHTNDDLVQQSYVVVPPERTIASLPLLLQHVALAEKSNGNCYKILVFLPTTAQVAYYTTLLRDAFGVRVLEMHSKMAQPSRDRTSARFRTATENTIMLTSDVSARGVDYPDVTHVFQFGVARDRETYIHRLGRTGRAGKSGQGILVLQEVEKRILTTDLAGLSLHQDDALQNVIQGPLPIDVRNKLVDATDSTRRGQNSDLASKAQEAYLSMLGYYHGRLNQIGVIGKGDHASKYDPLVRLVNEFAIQAGLFALPLIEARRAQMLGLAGHRHLRIRSGSLGSGRQWAPGRTFDVGRRT
jgi:ATP-dependent RNA helicase MSS116, mitochondrial